MIDFDDIFVEPIEKVDVIDILMNAIAENGARLLDLNEAQLDKGLKSDGTSVGRYKNFKYKNRYAPVDLKLKGDWRKGLRVVVDREGTEVKDDDFKDPFLVRRYGEDIKGFPIDEMAEIVRQDFENEYANQLL